MRRIAKSEHLIQAWLDTLQPEQREAAQALREAVAEAEPGLVPVLKWGNLMFTRGGMHAVAIAIHRQHAALQVFRGAALADRFPELEGVGKGMRQLRVRYRVPLDRELVAEVVKACVEVMATEAPSDPTPQS